jgi:adenylate cyclase class IV
VEAGEVEGLGLFVEAEKVLPAADDSEIRAWEKTLRDFLARIGVRPEDIESRPYSLMLAQGLG